MSPYIAHPHPNGDVTIVSDSPAYAAKLDRFLTGLGELSPHYRRLILEQQVTGKLPPIQLLERLPATSRAVYREELQGEALAALNRFPLVADSSSGSTSQCVFRMCGVVDELAEQAVTESAFRRAGMRAGDRFLCLEVGSPDIYDFYFRAARNLGARQSVFLHVTRDYTASVAPLPDLSPTVMLTIPSVLIRVWPYVKSLWPAGQSSIRSLIHMGEAMHPDFRAEVEATLGCRVYSFYGTTELGGIASECEHRCGGHFDPEQIGVTLTNVTAQSPTMVEGEALFTSLHLTHHAVVKYRVGDLVRVLLEPCACGDPSPRLQFIERTHDSFAITGVKFRYTTFVEAFAELKPTLSWMAISIADGGDGDDVVITFHLPTSARDHESRILAILTSEIYDLDAIYRYGLVRFELRFQELDAVARRKLPRVRDLRAQVDYQLSASSETA